MHAQGCTALRELRLNHNALKALPQGLSACQQLRIVDLADNPISALQPIKARIPAQTANEVCHDAADPAACQGTAMSST